MENDDWILVRDAFPSSGERCLVTDGHVIVLATYLLNAGKPTWLFSGLNVAIKSFSFKFLKSFQP